MPGICGEITLHLQWQYDVINHVECHVTVRQFVHAWSGIIGL